MPAKLQAQNVAYIVVHCSATPPQVKVDRAVIDRWHRERGWLGIGYHFVIKRDGTVETGRPLTDVGAHVEGFNEKSVGICLAGGTDEALKPQDNFTDEQRISLATTLKAMLREFPRAQIVGHRDLNKNKACPSFDVAKWWHETVAAPEVGE